ncbi:ABC transporter ATP-binding protein [Ligilactobacillus aviarius]|uniref:ABC transporter ATP-binding protein n=1 Tax=Ligilactobacillus aviarius TaxID=1606 RepID=UPI0025A40320|nr:ABC transporter ATP-binding protein [Ligilactobacillus aviarius]MDM8278644.1 ABC transporter ATP-binding protein [Ligilactobacillus aviarius]
MIRILAKSVRENKKYSIIAPILVFFQAMTNVAVPFLMGDLIDKGIMKGNLTYICHLGLLLLLLALAGIIAGTTASWLAGRAAAGFSKNLRYDLFNHIQQFSFENIDNFSSASLVTRLTTDTNNLQQAYQGMLRIAVRAPSVMIFAFVMAFVVSAKMALIFVVVIPILALGLFVIIKKARPLFHQVFQRYDVLNQVVREDVRGIRVVKSYVRQATEKQKFNDAADGIYDVFLKAQRTMALNAPLMQFVINATMLLLCWFGAKLIVGNQLQDGQLISMFSYTMQILMSLNMLSMIFNQLSMAEASASRVVRVLKAQPSIESPADGVQIVKDGTVDFDRVNFSYDHDPQKLQLQDINLHLKAGETLGIIGKTGSGKSTLVSLLPRLYDVTSGEVQLGGINVQDYDLKTLRDNVSVVLQNNVLFSGTVKDNLRWGDPHATDEQIIQACKWAHADEFIQKLPNGYDTMLEQNGTNVSGGQMQRLCIARALLKNPQVLILDDSTSAVDTNTDAQIRQAFRDELPHITKIIISQRISSISDADQIIVLDHGKITAQGTHAELLKSSKLYHDIYESQNYQGGEHHGEANS